MIDWKNIDYLREGNPKQQLCYAALLDTKILEKLKEFEPIVVGTIPIGVDVAESDVDIVCGSINLVYFQLVAGLNFGHFQSFTYHWSKHHFSCKFKYHEITIELYAEAIPSEQQKAYRHMIVEHRILKLAGDKFKNEIIKLRHKGYKTEPAFAKLLGLDDPYQDLLELEAFSDEELNSHLINRLHPSLIKE